MSDSEKANGSLNQKFNLTILNPHSFTRTLLIISFFALLDNCIEATVLMSKPFEVVNGLNYPLCLRHRKIKQNHKFANSWVKAATTDSGHGWARLSWIAESNVNGTRRMRDVGCLGSIRKANPGLVRMGWWTKGRTHAIIKRSDRWTTERSLQWSNKRCGGGEKNLKTFNAVM